MNGIATITDVLLVPAVGGYYYDDLAALQSRPMSIAEMYTAAPVTPGFRKVREVAEAVSVGLVLDGRTVAWGDCVAVAYSGKAGRHPVFRTRAGMETLRRVVVPVLQGRAVTRFRDMAAELDRLTDAEGEPLHTAIRFGVSQTLLEAVALSRGATMAEVIADEYDLPRPEAPVPTHAQSGAERYKNADKMIIRRVASLPHALVDNIPQQLGNEGGVLLEYARWLRQRIATLGGPDYHPTVHLDVHGTLGIIFEHDLDRVVDYAAALEKAVHPYPLRLESAVIMESREAQIEAFSALREIAQTRGLQVQWVVDEWANTLEDIQAFVDVHAADMVQIKMPDLGSVHNSIEAVLACRRGGVGAFLGGSCAETGRSARVAVHVALAARAEIIMAKPGMGVDEAVMLTQNEMARTLAWIRSRG